MSDLITAAIVAAALTQWPNGNRAIAEHLNAQLKPKLDKIDELIEDIEGAIGCTDGDDIRTHIEEALALYRGVEND